VVNLGCKVNRVESDTMSARLLQAGFAEASRDEAAVIVVNTCTVTAEADAKTRKAVRRAAAAPLDPWVIVTGCAAVAHEDELTSLGNKVIVVGEKPAACATAVSLLSQAALSSGSAPCCAGGSEGQARARFGERFNSRVGIKVQDGCDNRCSYCIVCIVRGPSRSVPLLDVIEEASCAVAAGARELVYTGINLGSWHNDGGGDLTDLLEASLDALPQARIRLSSIEPLDVTDRLLMLMAASKGRLCAHVPMPLQSGSRRVLRSMRRPYTAEQFLHVTRRARELVPHVAITSDLIVGFPGETDEEFAESLAVCQEAGIGRLHVFRYSPRPGTAAAVMPHQVPPATMAERSLAARELSDRLAAADAAARVGNKELVLVESHGVATSESYHRVLLTEPLAAGIERGALASVRFDACDGTTLLATVCGQQPL
jgi:threonylcarbamoyladenosine tRNA methylthiotransferase MtaB